MDILEEKWKNNYSKALEYVLEFIPATEER
jgi:hypothetical protein